jgi:transcriptional regulator with XRE-family HTH domain
VSTGWSAIAQVEAGRRTNLRPATLSALAGPLGVTIDYLVNGGASQARMLEHSAFLYNTNGQL